MLFSDTNQAAQALLWHNQLNNVGRKIELETKLINSFKYYAKALKGRKGTYSPLVLTKCTPLLERRALHYSL